MATRRRKSDDQYSVLALEFRSNCEEQRLMAYSAQEFENAGLPLLAEWYHVQAKALARRQFDLIELLRPYEQAMKGKAA